MAQELQSKTILVALGGSIIIPRADFIDTSFLKQFRKLILKYVKKGYKFIIVCGGGKTCRIYQSAATEIMGRLPCEDGDWIGVHSTRINAHLLRTIFRNVAYPVVLDNPTKPIEDNWSVLVASGWKPGWSTDYISSLLAKRFGIIDIIDAGNIPYVYDRDPNGEDGKNSKIIKEISWKEYRKLISNRWTPGLSAPIDPVASKENQKSNIRAIIVDGTDLENMENVFKGNHFNGTIIS